MVYYRSDIADARISSLERSIREDARYIREAKCIREELRESVKGYILDLKSNRLQSVIV
jgi:hypothetical protein